MRFTQQTEETLMESEVEEPNGDFVRFSGLPREVRHKVWTEEIEESRKFEMIGLIKDHTHPKVSKPYIEFVERNSRPVKFSTNKESREETLLYFEDKCKPIIQLTGPRHKRVRVIGGEYFNPERDTLLLPREFRNCAWYDWTVKLHIWKF